MTSCEIKAKNTIVDDIKEKASANKSWNSDFKIKDNTITVFFQSINENQQVALENAKKFKNSVEDTYSPFIYKEIAFINAKLTNGVEVSYNISEKLLKDQELRNNIDEKEDKDYYDLLLEIEEKQQEIINQIIYDNPEDYFSEDKNTGFEIYAVVNGVIQRDISKLVRIQDLTDIQKQEYKKNESTYRYSVNLSVENQERIVDQLTGMLMDIIANDLLNNKKTEIFYKEKVKIKDKELEFSFLNIKKAINNRVIYLYNKNKQNTITEEEKKEFVYLSSIWNVNVFLKIQEDILNRMKARGFKIKKDKLTLTEDDGNLKEVYEQITEEDDTDFEFSEGITGKSDQLSDYSAITVSNKEKMSSKLRTFLSSIKNDKPSLINLVFGNKVYNTQYVNENIVIQAINEVTIGLNTIDEVIKSLDNASKFVKGREFLSQVKEKLEVEKAKNTEIVNQFVDKFNQQKNNLTIVTYEKKPIIAYSFNNKDNERIDVYLKDEDGNSQFYYDYKVINANRNDIATNLKEEIKERFIEKNNLTEEVIPNELLQVPYASYLDFIEYVKQNYEEGSFKNPKEAVEKIKNLFSSLEFELSDEVYEELIENKRNRLKINFNLDGKGSESAFNKSYGLLHLVFGNLKDETVEKTLDSLFGNSGARKLFKLESELKEYRYNTSTLNGKGKNIWGYSMPSPVFRELFDLLEKNYTLPNKEEIPMYDLYGNEEYSLYTSSSQILNQLRNLSTEEKILFKENLKVSLFDTLKQKNKEGKDLTEMEEAEFIASQLILHIGSTVKTRRDTYWSNKFLTTPSDKTLMYIFQTPNTNISTQKGKAKIGNNEVEIFYNYFLGEYRRAKAYQDGDENYKAKIDQITTYEPLVFFNFPQLNLKNEDNILWKKDGDTWVLRDLDEVVGTISVSDHVKVELLKQLEELVESTRRKLEEVGLIKDEKFINGIPDSYKKRVPEVALLSDINLVKDSKSEIGTENFLKEFARLTDESNIRMTDYMVHDYAINYLFHNIEMHLLLLGDPAQFLKDEKQKFINNNLFNSNNISEIVNYIDAIEDNLSKRMAGAQANRMEGNTENESSRIVTIEDISTESKIFKELQTLNPESSEKLKKIKSMDGQEIMTAEEDLKQKLIHGKINQEQYNSFYEKVQRQHEDIEKYKHVTEENKFTEEELENFIAQPIKPVVFGNIYDAELKILKATYYKDSAFGLYPQFTQGLELDKIRKALYNLRKTKNINVDRLVMKSAAKLGSKNIIKGVFNSDFSVNQNALENITEENIDLVPRSRQGIQLEVPYDPTKDSIRIASQQIKLIFNEILNVSWDNQKQLISKFLPELNNVKVTGRVLRDFHNNIYKGLVENSLSSILNEIGINLDINSGTYTFENLEKLKNSLERTAVELGWSKISLEGLTITPDKKEFVLPVSFSKNSKRIEKLLLSLLNKAILQKISGRSFILASEMGFVLDKSWIQELKKQKPESEEITENVIEGKEGQRVIKQYESSIIFTDNFDIDRGLLPARRKDPNDINSEILPAQVLVSWKFTHNGKQLNIEDFVEEKDGRKFLDTSKIDPEILRILGIRIPTQGHPSMSSIEIVGFLPKFMGDIIIAPQDFVAIMGSDFDIDKLYGYIYNYQFKKGKISKLKFDESKVSEIDEEEIILDTDLDFIQAFDKVEELKLKREEYIKKQKKKMLQNKLIDIYHAIMLHPTVYDKSLKGITEGRLGELADELKSKISKKNYSYYSPFSPIKKVEEYFENKAGRLGVGVFSVNSTFLTVIEGLGLYLKKPVVKSEKDENQEISEEEERDYFTIPINSETTEEPIKFYRLSNANGVNTLISMFQSASVDNAKLKYLKWINVNKDTMGVTAILCALADDSILGEDDKPLLNEDYIVYFVSQPSIRQYIDKLNSQNSFTDYVDVETLIDEVSQDYRNKIIEQIKTLSPEDYAAKLNLMNSSPSYSLQQLKDFVNKFEEDKKYNDVDYLIAQYQIFNKFISLKERADVLRQLQYLINADSKGLPSTLAESNYKKLRTDKLIAVGNPLIGNVDRVFLNYDPSKEPTLDKKIDKSKEIKYDDASMMTLHGYLNYISNDLAVRIFSKNNKILASGSVHVSKLTELISLLSGKRTETYPYNLVNKITDSYIAYLQSSDELEIQSPDKTAKQEVLELLKDTESTTSLATDIENFKKTETYKNSILLKPFLESLKLRNYDGFRFVDYIPSQGLLNTDEQIVQALTELLDLDEKIGTYPLFEKIIKYTFLVKVQNSPITIRQFIPLYYQEAIGLTNKLREINKRLNDTIGPENEFLNIPVVFYELDGKLPIYAYTEQFFQHFPEELKSVKFDDFIFLDEKMNETSEKTDIIMIKGVARRNYTNILGKEEFDLPYVSVYNYDEKRPNIYKKLPDSNGVYYRIPNLGRYNLDEFNRDSFSTVLSLLPSNNVKDLQTEVLEIPQPTTKDISIEKITSFYSGLTKQQKEKIGTLEELVKQFKELGEGYPVNFYLSEIQKTIITKSSPEKQLLLGADNLKGKANSVLLEYGITDDQTDQEKIKTILEKISIDSQSDQFKELANLLKELDNQFNFTKDLKINLVQNQDSFYNPNDNSINLNISQKDNQGNAIPAFSQRIQFEILHELIHSVLDARLGLDEAGNIVKNRIGRLINTLQSRENLQKAIDYFQLKDDFENEATVDYLLDKLSKLRGSTQDVNGVKYNTDSERSVLNPLINEREFIASVLGDDETRNWMNQVDYEGTGSVLSRIIDAFKTFFNNLIRTFGFKIKDKSALKEAMNIVFDLVNYEPNKANEIVEYLEFGNYYRFEIDGNGVVVKGEYSQGGKNNYKLLSKPSKKYQELLDSTAAQKLSTVENVNPTPNVKTNPTASGKQLLGEQVQAFEKAYAWLTKPSNSEADENGMLTEEAILDNMFFLSGPGGSGKTFITEIIVSELMKKGKVALSAAAPTHQAKNVLKENLPKNTPATTVQALMKMLPNPINKSTFIGNTLETIEDAFYNGKAPFIFNYDYLVIDEASMIDGSKPLVKKEYKAVWSDIENRYVDKEFYENPDLGTYLKEVLKLKYKLTGKPTKVFLMGDVVQVVPIGVGKFEISKLLTELLKRENNHALLNEIRRTNNQEVKKISLSLRESFNSLFKDNNAQINFINILNSVNPNNDIHLLNSKKDVIENFIRLYKENIESGNPIPNYTNIIWYNNSTNDKTVNQTRIIRQLLFNNQEEINVNESLILKSNYSISNYFGEGKDLFLGADTKLIVTEVQDDVSSFPVGKGRKVRIISNIPVKRLIANVQIGSLMLEKVPITIVTPSYYKLLADKFKEQIPVVEGQQLTKGELYNLIENITNVEYGYIVNSHKIQGSKVINPIVDAENIFNSPEDLLHINNMLYTAISRAVNSLYIYHPQLTPVDGKPISKLTGINNPQQPSSQPKESTQTQDISIDYLTQRLHLQQSRRTSISNDKSLTDEERSKKMLVINSEIAKTEANLKAIQENFKLSEYFRIAQKELNDLNTLVKQAETLTEGDIYQAIQILTYFNKLYTSLKSEVENYNDVNSISEKTYVSPELFKKVKRYQSVANSLRDELISMATDFFVKVYNNKTGKAISLEEFTNSEPSSWFRKTMLSTNKSMQQSVRSVSQIVIDMSRQIEQSQKDHADEDANEFRKFEKKFSFKELIRLIDYTDPHGIKRKESTFITRNSIAYYLERSRIFKDADFIYDKKQKFEYIREKINDISYTIDARFLFVDEFMNEMKEYYEDNTIDWLNSNSESIYQNRILEFHKNQLSGYDQDYIEYRNNDVIEQAKRKINAYLENKKAFILSLSEQKLSEEERKIRYKDWIAYNSPFLLLNEMLGFSKSEGATKDQRPFDTAKEQTPKAIINSSGEEVMIKPTIDFKKRNSKNYILSKARYKYENGEETGFYDSKYSEMEQEMLAKNLRIKQLEDAGDKVGAQKEKENLILWDYLQFAQERQKYYLDMLPYYIRKDIKWFNLIDVEKDYKEQFDEKLNTVLSFKGDSFTSFMKDDLLGLFGLTLNYFYDPVVKKVSERYIEKRKNYIDFVTDQIKLNYDPSGFNNTLNKIGIGNIRTTDVFNYFSYLRDAAIQFREKSETEELIKIGQFLVANITTIDKTSSEKLKLTDTELAGLNWQINTKLYGANKEETYRGTDHNLWKVASSKGFALTKNERDRVKILTNRIEYLKSILPTLKNARKIAQVNEELSLASSQLESLKRQINKYTLFSTYSFYVSLKRLSFGIKGRILDFFATFSAGIKQGLDGRIYGLDSYFKSLRTIIYLYSPNAAASLTTAAGVVSLNPALAATGIGIRFGTGIVDQTLRKKQFAKINQILYRLGALDYMNYKEDDNVSSFVTKTNLTEEAIASIKTISPFSTLSQVEVINKGIPALALFYETKITDKNGKEHSLIDAFDVDDDLNLVWKEDEFGSQEQAGFNWYKGEKMKRLINFSKSAQILTGGDYDITTSKYVDASVLKKALLLLRRFITEFINARVGSPNIDEATGLMYYPTYTAFIISASRMIPKWREKESKAIEEARKIANKQLIYDIALLSSLTYLLSPLIQQIIKNIKGDDDDDEEIIKLKQELNFLESLEYDISSAFESFVKNELQFIDPNIFRGRVNTGTISPLLTDFLDAYKLVESIGILFTEKGDTMTHREMISKGLAPKRKILYYRSKYTKENGKYVKKIVPVYKFEYVNGEPTRGKYSKNYEPKSRVVYNLKRFFPFTNLYINYQRILKNKLQEEEKKQLEELNKK
jgi:hypothetical protein